MKRPKPKPPRAVRAWACGFGDGEFAVQQGQIPVFMKRADAKFDCEMANDLSRPVPVRLVPDTTPSAEAENRRLLRRAWRELKRSPFPEDRRLADEIDAALRRRR
jgi:hypothetical protein